MTAYLILHGWQNHRPENHWQHWLADRLTDLGHHVAYPQLPDPDDPDLDVWLTELARHLGELPATGERAVLAHSASALLWLHAVDRGLPGPAGADRVLLVAPPSASVLAQHPQVAAFAPPALEFALPGPTRLVAGDDDPYCPEGARETFGEPLGIPTDILPGAAHLDLDAGYGPWPAVLDWCLDPDAAITPRR
ncbi:putative alpha/beta hydrolase family esterase [Streptomyces sp. SAI-117]|uniref:RBBP9/YdeN family alpha/beta hydrolase n=1 Tax=Streptomyces sp. SAI-117 TaxID=2940546 RepID=UPI002476A329|nr:alpha/beta hydrolase [Streptomyces sp. SAI-117]MDH6570196.1 putative alpha/beta hydrolase family esterase [Streptomyces sp. SAI-117]